MSNRKGKRRFTKLIAVLIAALVVTGVYVGNSVYNDRVEAQTAADEIDSLKPTVPDVTDSQIAVAQTPLPLMDFSSLNAANPDVIAWIKIPNTIIDDPIARGTDNDFYMHHGVNKQYSIYGTVMLDCRVAPDFSDFNNVIYGHNMKNGTRFGTLIRFKQRSFFDANPTGVLYTPKYTYRLQIFAVSVIVSTSDLFRYNFSSVDDQKAYIAELKTKAMFWRDVPISDGKSIVTLTCCSYEFKNARTIVSAVLAP